MDYLSVVWFLVWWVGYTKFSELERLNRPNLISAMAQRRAAWMRQMLQRDNQIVDIKIVRCLGAAHLFCVDIHSRFSRPDRNFGRDRTSHRICR